jgi:lipopolysaccharide transport system ATP-binding protein
MQFHGPIDEAVSLYLTQDYLCSTKSNLADRADRSGSGAIRVLAISLIDDQGGTLGSVPCGGTCRIAFEYEVRSPAKYPQLAFTVSDHRGQCLSRPSSYDAGFDRETWPSRGTLVCTLPRLPLFPGRYRINTQIKTGGEVLDYIEGAYTLQVDEADFFGTGRLNPHTPVLFDQKWSLNP